VESVYIYKCSWNFQWEGLTVLDSFNVLFIYSNRRQKKSLLILLLYLLKAEKYGNIWHVTRRKEVVNSRLKTVALISSDSSSHKYTTVNNSWIMLISKCWRHNTSMIQSSHLFTAYDQPHLASQQNKSVRPSPDKSNIATALNCRVRKYKLRRWAKSQQQSWSVHQWPWKLMYCDVTSCSFVEKYQRFGETS
jgi:hypothetical protein